MGRALARWLGVAVILSTGVVASGDVVFRSSYHDFRLVTVADGLEQPWSIAFLPDGDILVTELPGRLRIIRQGTLLAEPVAGVPPVLALYRGGLLEVAAHPDFATNRVVYLSYAKPIGDGTEGTTALIRARLENDRLVDVQQIFESASRGLGHFSGKIAFDRAGYLFMTLGDRQAPPEGILEAHPAQDLSTHHGVTIRLHDDGRVPADNPFVGRAGARPEVWTYGHRNVQGLAIHPETGDIWANEHGPQGGDELNRLTPGANYGWPVVGFGVNYRTGLAIHAGTHRDGMEQPVHIWVPSIAVSGLMVYTGDRFPHWKGNLFAGSLAGQRLVRLTLQGTRVVGEETLLRQTGRVREVRQGPDGFIYLAIEDRGAPSAILRMEPVVRSPVE